MQDPRHATVYCKILVAITYRHEKHYVPNIKVPISACALQNLANYGRKKSNFAKLRAEIEKLSLACPATFYTAKQELIV